MATSKAKTVKEYLAELTSERRPAIQAVRAMILKNLPDGYEECMQYGMICYVVPLKLFPNGYLLDKKTPIPYVALGAQKDHMAVCLTCVYGSEETTRWFTAAYKKTGKRLDMGKSCVRFKKLDDLPLEVIGEAIARVPVQTYIGWCEQAWSKRRR